MRHAPLPFVQLPLCDRVGQYICRMLNPRHLLHVSTIARDCHLYLELIRAQVLNFHNTRPEEHAIASARVPTQDQVSGFAEQQSGPDSTTCGKFAQPELDRFGANLGRSRPI